MVRRIRTNSPHHSRLQSFLPPCGDKPPPLRIIFPSPRRGDPCGRPPQDFPAHGEYLSFACPKEGRQRKRHQGGELRPCAAGGRRSKAAISAAAPQGELPHSGKRGHPGVLAGRREAGPGMANAARWRDFVFCPPCGARKMLRAYAFPCIFRPLRKRHQPFIRHWRRAGAFSPPWTLPN